MTYIKLKILIKLSLIHYFFMCAKTHFYIFYLIYFIIWLNNVVFKFFISSSEYVIYIFKIQKEIFSSYTEENNFIH